MNFGLMNDQENVDRKEGNEEKWYSYEESKDVERMRKEWSAKEIHW